MRSWCKGSRCVKQSAGLKPRYKATSQSCNNKHPYINESCVPGVKVSFFHNKVRIYFRLNEAPASDSLQIDPVSMDICCASGFISLRDRAHLFNQSHISRGDCSRGMLTMTCYFSLSARYLNMLQEPLLVCSYKSGVSPSC